MDDKTKIKVLKIILGFSLVNTYGLLWTSNKFLQAYMEQKEEREFAYKVINTFLKHVDDKETLDRVHEDLKFEVLVKDLDL